MVEITREKFNGLSSDYNLIPIYKIIDKGDNSPVSVYKNLKDRSNTFLLESVEGNKDFARYSFIGLNPKKIIKTGDNENFKSLDPLNELEKQISDIKIPKFKNLPEFNSGAVGFISYEAVSYFEPSVEKIKDQTSYFPESIFFITSSLIIFDNEENKIFIVSHADLRKAEKAEYEYEKALDDIQILNDLIDSSENIENNYEQSDQKELKINFLTDKEEFMKSVVDTKKLIYSGEMIQAVLSQKITAEVESEAIDIFSSLRKVNPSPYMFLLDCDDFKIIGSSPELLVKLQGGKTAVHPIAGTRPRGVDEKDDLKNEKDLLNDEKEISEHLMLLDLGRNDLGKIAVPGSVKVTQQMEIERYSHVMHIVSHVEADINPKFNAFDVLRSAFPAGTVTGAPKVRAMKLISEKEKYKRGPYSGAVGYFSYDGNMDTAIAIRTIVLKDNLAILQAGAGIVADSDPETEHNECLAKMGALIKALEHAEKSKYK
tara:strand:- start:113 stop:1570 length:1458 start_codon:yes stop_codon:yes gene_type:complete